MKIQMKLRVQKFKCHGAYQSGYQSGYKTLVFVFLCDFPPLSTLLFQLKNNSPLKLKYSRTQAQAAAQRPASIYC